MQQYAKGEKLGQGKWGTVWKAVDKSTTQPLALKVIPNSLDHGGTVFTLLHSILILFAQRVPRLEYQKAY